jgi:AraC-like DNA-binding protein
LNESATDVTASSYREWRPRPSWCRVVQCWWEQRVTGGQYVQRVLPDSCADIIVAADGRAVVAGPAYHVSLPELPAGTVRGLRLRPEAIGAVFGLDATVLVDATTPLDAVVSSHRAAAVAEMLMAGDLAGDDGGDETRRWWTDVVIDGRVGAACAALGSDVTITVDQVADDVGLSGRQLRRLPLEATGQGPKMHQRVGRLQRFLDLAERGPFPLRLAEVAAASGYADQAHLCREVQDLGGTTPANLLPERRSASLEPAAATIP